MAIQKSPGPNKLNQAPAYWAVVPAAGLGKRMGSARPKQYLPLLGKTVIEHSIAALLELPLKGLLVATHPDDGIWSQLPIMSNANIEAVAGGDERHHSVLNALLALEGRAEDNDWVLVHDAVRPCVDVACIQRLMDQLQEHPVGGLLGYPLSDTLKKVDGNRQVQATVDRNGMWAAATPQLFRYAVLLRAMRQVCDKTSPATDEAMAVEALGLHPQMVAGRRDNIKITVPGDLELAALILESRTLQANSQGKQFPPHPSQTRESS